MDTEPAVCSSSSQQQQQKRPPMTEEIEQMLTCPISHEFMNDPVTIVQSQMTCDRQSLLQWMDCVQKPNHSSQTNNPHRQHRQNRCPITGQTYKTALTCIDCIPVRQLLILYLGEDQYRPCKKSSLPGAREFKLGVQYERGRNGAQQNILLARLYYNSAAQKGHVQAQYNLGHLCYHNKHGKSGGSGSIHAQAARYFAMAASQGHGGAHFFLAECFRYGKGGVGQHYAKAKDHYQQAMEAGIVNAFCSLGMLYHKGLGVRQDYQLARDYFQHAAQQGNASGQYMLAYIYHHGDGVGRDYKLARTFYKLAAAQGDAHAQYGLGVLYENGHGGPKDCAKARSNYQAAAKQGHARAQRNLQFVAEATLKDFVWW